MLFPQWLSVSKQKTKVICRPFFVFVALSAGLSSLPAEAESGAYVPYSGIIHGTDGADPVKISVVNDAVVPLVCEAALAHWYSDELGRVSPGEELTLTLWHDQKTGVFNLMNATDDRMPVEALWCASDAGRTRLTLPIASGKAEATLRYSCHDDGETGLSCETAGG
jgi:hypothetical protein